MTSVYKFAGKALFIVLLFITLYPVSLKAQNNLAAGNIAIVSYQSDFDPTNSVTFSRTSPAASSPNDYSINLTEGFGSVTAAGKTSGTTSIPISSSVISTHGGMATTLINEGFDVVSPLPAGWEFQNLSSPVGLTNWFQGNNSVFNAQTGATNSYIGANFNNTTSANTISNWLFTPNITLTNGDVFTFWSRTVDVPSFPDRLEVRLSTNGASVNAGATNVSVGDFTTLLLTINPTLTVTGFPSVWTQYTITISGLGAPTSGRLAFRYFVTNGGPSGANSDYFGIDNVVYTQTGVISCPAISVTNPATTTGTAGTAFSQSFTSSGGTATVTYTTSSTLPTGLSLSTAGVLSGTPTQTGTFTITVTATDGNNCTGTGSAYTLVISCPPMTVDGLTNQTRIGDGIVTFTVTNAGSYTVQWSTDGTNNDDGTGASKPVSVSVGAPVKRYARLYDATTLCTGPWSLDYYGTAYNPLFPLVFGSTRYGQSNGSGSDFVDKNGKLGDIPMLSNCGQDFSVESTNTSTLTVTLISVVPGAPGTYNAFYRIPVSSTPVIARGICWGATATPDIYRSHTVDGSGVLDLTTAITAASGNSVRAWAINSSGLHYSAAIIVP